LEPVVEGEEVDETICTSVETAPAEYIKLNMGGMAFVKEDDSSYLSDVSKLTPLIPNSAGENLTAEEVIEEDWTYSYASGGVSVGDSSTAGGGYVGCASYLVTDGTWSFNTNSYNIDGTIYDDICVNLDADDECGEMREATPGFYKFALFGVAEGADLGVLGNTYEIFAALHAYGGIR